MNDKRGGILYQCVTIAQIHTGHSAPLASTLGDWTPPRVGCKYIAGNVCLYCCIGNPAHMQVCSAEEFLPDVGECKTSVI